MSAKIHGSNAVRIAVAIALGTFAVIASAPQARAADADTSVNKPASTDESAQLEEVTVTGSRIKRKDLAASSPLVTIESEQLEQRAGLNLESFLSQLPQFNPALTPTNLITNQDVQATPVNSVGIATISLRGFGANRSLVLVDGHRTTPINLLMETDINSIPAAMIDRVEIITGGASAVYGADAIGGVTNFIMKKNYEGAQVDVQDGITQAGDGNELRVSTLMGSKIADGRGNIVMGMEYYDRDAAYQKNRSFFTNAWTDPGQPGSNALFTSTGSASIFTEFAGPSNAAVNTVLAPRIAAGGSPYAFGSGNSTDFQFYGFNTGGSIFAGSFLGGVTGPYQSSGWTGPTTGNGYGPFNMYDPTTENDQSAAGSNPSVVQGIKRNDTQAFVSSPQTRYSFFANGNFDITDKIQFYTDARFAESLTHTYLDAPPSLIGGWSASIPFNPTTDSPINPTMISPASTAAQLAAIAAAFAGAPAANTYLNPNFIANGVAGAQHPVPWQLAMLLDTRSTPPFFPPVGTGPGSPTFGGSFSPTSGATCNNTISPSLCVTAPTSWNLWWGPYQALPARATTDTSTAWQIETGLRFPLMVSDWTGDVYYSRGQSSELNNAYGNASLQRFEAVIDSPDYGAGQVFQGNQNNGGAGFGTGVPATCTSGFYQSLFGGDVPASPNCASAIGAVTTSQTSIQQDIVEANFQGTLFKLPAGDMSGAFGYEYRRVAGQFIPDTLNSTSSFLDQTLGLYPLGALNNSLASRDGYLELLIPVLSDLPLLKKLNLDIGGRYSSFDNTPSATTFKINVDDQLTNSLRIRAGYNRATRSPNLGELYLPEQQQFSPTGTGIFNDPCSLRSNSPFGAGAAAPDTSPTKSQGPAALVNAQGAAGALSTYLICQAQMNTAAAQDYYVTTGQASVGGGGSSFPNQEGNPNLKSETANTWTAGFVFSALGDNPWIAGLSGSVDWWQVHINNAIEFDSGDYANYLCYGGTPVTTAAQAAAVAASVNCTNVARNSVTGAVAQSLQVYQNQATIGTAGVDFAMNWIAQLSDIGFKSLPGAITFNSQDTFLDYYRTKASTAYFDLDTNWKDSMGPDLAGTDGGAYGYRLTAGLGYVLPSFGVNLSWRFLPSVNQTDKPSQEAIIANNNAVKAGAPGVILSYTPSTSIAAPAWYALDLSFNWTINKTYSLRAGVRNILDKDPALTSRSGGYPVGVNLTAVCGTAPGCLNPTAHSLPNDGAGITNGGFYDTYGRTFFLGGKAQF
jgi:iron complex outermembrane receptor protein